MKKKVFSFFMVLIPILFFLVVFEIIAPKLIKVPHFTYRFWGNRPLTYYPNKLHRAVKPYYDVYFTANSWGYKDIRHDTEKMKGIYRVLLIGDSFVEALGVPSNKHMARIIENIAKSENIDLEVIAMGMAGYGTAHYLSTYERLGKKFDPDIVITFFCTNDLRNNVISNIYTLKEGDLIDQM